MEQESQTVAALEAKVAQDGIVLTEAQLTALEKKKEDEQAHGEIETEHPGYLGSQDTFYVGTIKGVGRIYGLLKLFIKKSMMMPPYSKLCYGYSYNR